MMIGAIGFGIILGLFISDITAQYDCNDCRCCNNGDCNYSGTCRSGCKNGYWDSRCDKTCTSNCVRCSIYNGDYCYDCQQGYFVRHNNVCGKCIYSGCTCTSYYGCDECLEGYYDPSRRCIKCPNNCKKCTSSSSCSSCNKGFYGSSCQYQCGTDCINGVCNSDRAACDCNSSYAGTHCEECAIGRYGPECKNVCYSGCVDIKCERATGTCFCKTGWTGNKCNKCLPNFYGNQCSPCRAECSDCDEYNSCQSCMRGKYGSYCQNTCGKGCVNNECLKSYGQCQCQSTLFEGYQCASCVPGKYGQYCNIDCPDSCYSCTEARVCTSCKTGFFGKICEHNCSESCTSCTQLEQCVSCSTGYSHPRRQCICQDKMCSTTDSCDQCVSNEYFPDNGSCCPCSLLPHCKSCNVTSNITKCTACDEGFYPNESGECFNCSLTCIEGQCNSLTGECKTGCESDYWGQFCEHKCNESCYSCNRSNGECLECASKLKYGTNCNINCSETCVDKECYISGKCIKGCLENNFGEMCENECDKNCISKGNGTICSSESGKCLHGCTPGYTAVVCPQMPQGETQTLSGSPAAAIGGGVAGGAILIIAIIGVIAFFLLKKRRAGNSYKETTTLKTDQNEEQHVDSSAVYATVNKNTVVQPDAIYANTVDDTPQIILISNPSYQTPPEKNTCSEMTCKEDNLEIDDEDAIAREIAIRFEENGRVYYNNTNEVNKTKVKVEELPTYVTAKTKSSYEDEFEKFPYGLTKPYEDSQKASNMSRNRYKGIYPYDDARVKVLYNGSDYINASFIDGFKRRNEYVATLGPMSKQLGDFGLFWEMVWQQKVENVVMVTNLIEENKGKCDQYWPNVGSSARYGNVNVTCLSEDEYAEITRRTFQIFQSSTERKLHQFHFTCWPDRSVPEDVTSLVEFRKMVLNTSTKLNGPTVVHCSAGVGRTGTYIAFDILTKEGEAEGSIDIPGCVLNMRQNRPNMIQTLEQYQFLHRALVHSLTLNCNPVKGESYQPFLDSLNDGDWAKLFQQTQFTAEEYSEKESQAIARNKTLKGKNRQNADIPGDGNRPRLNKGMKEGRSDYINAVFINGHRTKNRFLVAQTPLPETVDDFLTLIYQESCSCIVSFETDIGNNKSVGSYFPADNQVLKKGAFNVKSLRQDGTIFYTNRTLMLEATGQNKETVIRSIPHLAFTAWDSSKNAPRSATEFLDFINYVEEASRTSASRGPILIHCIDGASKSGLFCVVSLLIQKMAVEHEVSVVNAVRKVKARRRLAIPIQCQLEFCHECVLAYIKSFENNLYSNFGETH